MKALLKSFSPLAIAANQTTGGQLDGYIKKIRNRLRALGEPDDVTAESILGVQLVSAVVTPILIVYVMRFFNMGEALFNGPVQILLYIGLISFGFYFPMMNLGEKVAARQKEIILYLPDFMDLLTISVDAGLDFLTAMNRVVDKQPDGPLREEMVRFFKQLELGRSRRDGLRELADRVQIKDLNNVCAALIQADRLGSSIGPVLQAQSDMLRIQRGQRAEKAALEAPVKMMAPLLCCIFPAVFIMILAPVGIQIMIDRGLIQP